MNENRSLEKRAIAINEKLNQSGTSLFLRSVMVAIITHTNAKDIKKYESIITILFYIAFTPLKKFINLFYLFQL